MIDRFFMYYLSLCRAIPEIMLLLSAVVLLALVIVCWVIFKAVDLRIRGRAEGFSIDANDRLMLISGGLSSGMLLATCLAIPNPRYFVLALPFVVVSFWLWLSRWIKPHVRIALIGGWLLANLFNQFGFLYPNRIQVDRLDMLTEIDELTLFMARERDRSISSEIRMDRRAIDFIVREYPNSIIITNAPMSHMLSLPMLGYVDHPMMGYSDETDTDFVYPMCPLESLFDLVDTNSLMLDERPMLMWYDFSLSGRLPTEMDPIHNDSFYNDERVYFEDRSFDSIEIWKLDPQRVRDVLRKRGRS